MAVQSVASKPVGEKTQDEALVVTGPASAAFIAGGIGCFVIGLLTTLAEGSASIKSFLQWDDGVGPLAGKTGYGVIIFFLAWAILHFMWRDKNVDIKRSFYISMGLTALGFLGTFPIFFQLFG